MKNEEEKEKEIRRGVVLEVCCVSASLHVVVMPNSWGYIGPKVSQQL
jgi:hypothetical protein